MLRHNKEQTILFALSSAIKFSETNNLNSQTIMNSPSKWLTYPTLLLYLVSIIVSFCSFALCPSLARVLTARMRWEQYLTLSEYALNSASQLSVSQSVWIDNIYVRVASSWSILRTCIFFFRWIGNTSVAWNMEIGHRKRTKAGREVLIWIIKKTIVKGTTTTPRFVKKLTSRTNPFPFFTFLYR